MHFSIARRPDSPCRSREPEGVWRDDGEGWGRRSNSVIGREVCRREASVRPEGPAPMIAIFGEVGGIVFGVEVEAKCEI